MALWISCGYDGGFAVRGGSSAANARTLAVKAGVSFAKPDMMTVPAVTISVYVDSSLWEVYSEKIRRSQQLAQGVHLLMYVVGD